MVLVPSRILKIYGLVLVATLAYWPSIAALWAFWFAPENLSSAHGPAIAAICLWLIFRERHRLAAADEHPLIIVNAALFLCGLVWVVFLRASIQDAHLLLYPALIGLAALATFGWSVMKLLLFPLGYFIFALPVWNSLAFPLRDLTTLAVGLLAWLTGLPSYIEGNFVTIPAGTFEIAGGCSGMHFFVVGLAVAALQGELGREPLRRRLLLLVIMAGLAVVTNWVRVFGIIVAGHLTDMRHFLVTVDHYWFGWGLFAVAMALFGWIARSLPATQPVEGNAAAPVPRTRDRMPTGYVAAVITLVAAPVMSYALQQEPAAEGSLALVTMPEHRDGWSGPLTLEESEWRPIFIGAHGEMKRAYRDTEGRVVEVFAVTYLVQRQGAELVGHGNSLLGEEGLISEGESIVRVGNLSFRESLARNERGDRSLIWSVYDIGGRRFVTPLVSQVWYGLVSLIGAPRATLLALRIQCEPTCDDGRATLERFVAPAGKGPGEVLTVSSKGGQ